MITIRLMGGLGNTLFQYAFGRALQSRGARVVFDRSHLTQPGREYQLDRFRTVLELGQGHGPTIFEPSLRYCPGMLDLREGTLIGYWQCERYFASIESQLRDELMPRAPGSSIAARYAQEVIDSADRNCFLHVRRGDYLNLTHFHGMPGLDYYEAALARVRERTPNPRVFVFSDDVPWCRENFDPVFTFVEGTQAHEDLALMAGCRHAILANSSFSWWGSWLGGYREERTVVCPSRWFTTDQADGTDIPCDWWERL